MPTYAFRNTETGDEWTEFMSNSEREEYLAKSPHIIQLITSINIVAGVAAGRNKPDAGFRDVLKEIKSKHRGSTVNTW